MLDAAHIRGVAEGGRHELPNGLLLRADVHRLFDRGYVTVTPDDLRVRVSRKLREDFDDGEPYLPLDRREIWTPADPALRAGAGVPGVARGDAVPGVERLFRAGARFS